MDPHQKRSVMLQYASGFREEVEVISDAGPYKALYRFGHPEHRVISQWLAGKASRTWSKTSRGNRIQPSSDPPYTSARWLVSGERN